MTREEYVAKQALLSWPLKYIRNDIQKQAREEWLERNRKAIEISYRND